MTVSRRYRSGAREYFSVLAAIGGPSWKRAGWSSPESQRRRWQVFADALDFRGYTLLDLGAGSGGLRSFLAEIDREPSRYLGVEPIEANCTILAAEPGVDNVICGNIDATRSRPFVDYVVASGLFNFDDPLWAEHFVAECCLSLARVHRAVAVNAIVPESKWHEALEHLDGARVSVRHLASGDAREMACIMYARRK